MLMGEALDADRRTAEAIDEFEAAQSTARISLTCTSASVIPIGNNTANC